MKNITELYNTVPYLYSTFVLYRYRYGPGPLLYRRICEYRKALVRALSIVQAGAGTVHACSCCAVSILNCKFAFASGMIHDMNLVYRVFGVSQVLKELWLLAV